ncbi:hypothetical protein [Metapseudomonas otitidis]|uniref:hypothetical protein n=1 Tax=Metapseudomonas otitidis TaxID=319939 RepID=UPI000D1A3F77|nr:hypothetical protein [Pseudomonas otitidis]
MNHDDDTPGLAGSWHQSFDDSAPATPRTLPADVRALLDNLPGVPRDSLAHALQQARAADPLDDAQSFHRGLVAGLIIAAEQRGELSSTESGDLMFYALGMRGLA